MNHPPDQVVPGSGESDPTPRRPGFRPLRTWPALVLVALIFAARFGPLLLEGGLGVYWMLAVFGPMLCCLLLLIWWVTASRATGKERLFGFLGIVGSIGLTLVLVHPTMRGPGTTYLTLPMGMVLFAVAATVLRSQRPGVRTSLAVLMALAGFGFSILLRNEGMTGDYVLGTHWRWTQTPEASMLAARAADATNTTLEPVAARIKQAVTKPEWPGFRGPDRASRSSGPKISTNWTAQPPRQLWKIPVGPGWSSFAVAGHYLFTQEQRGPMETVVCYDGDTGQEIWNQQVETRLDDPLGGPGPRATPTLGAGTLSSTGATGTFLALDPATGEVKWKRDLTVAANRKVPMWGFAGSPLVVGSLVIIYTGGPDSNGMLAFDVPSGGLRWSAAAGDDSYGSPQLNTVAGEELVLMLSNQGLVFVDPATGKQRLNYEWKFMNYRALQPHVLDGDVILLPTGMNAGTRAIQVTKTNGTLAAAELWTSRNLKPDFNDLVSYQGYAYGADGGIFTCVDLKTGKRKWKGGRYGKGQVLLLENSGLLLVAAEQGQVVLLKADPEAHVEVASFQALKGKTWNHPVVVGSRLYLRNSQEAAAFELPLAGASPTTSVAASSESTRSE